jgi:hypothetical protein
MILGHTYDEYLVLLAKLGTTVDQVQKVYGDP